MTATPLRDDNRDTYLYFGNPDLRIQPAPGHRRRLPRALPRASRRHRMGRGRLATEQGRAGPLWPRRSRTTNIRPRTSSASSPCAPAPRPSRGISTDFLKKTDRFAKTIVFCVDQEHASEMRQALGQPQRRPCARSIRTTSAASPPTKATSGAAISAGFRTWRPRSPAILTTSQLLTTGVDAPTCKNVVLARVVGSMTEFKQIIGRGTRVRDDYGKLWFNIIDYTGSATRMFADPDFDGDPVTDHRGGD